MLLPFALLLYAIGTFIEIQISKPNSNTSPKMELLAYLKNKPKSILRRRKTAPCTKINGRRAFVRDKFLSSVSFLLLEIYYSHCASRGAADKSSPQLFKVISKIPSSGKAESQCYGKVQPGKHTEYTVVLNKKDPLSSLLQRRNQT